MTVKDVDISKLTFDFSKASYHEIRNLNEPGQPEEEACEIIARVCGLTAEQIQNIPFKKFRKLMKAFWTEAYATDPNSESESTAA